MAGGERERGGEERGFNATSKMQPDERRRREERGRRKEDLLGGRDLLRGIIHIITLGFDFIIADIILQNF
jgi:hypothetical protein